MKVTQPIIFVALVLATSSLALPTANADLDARAVTEGNTVMQRSPSIFGKIFKGAASVAKGFLGFRRDGLTETSINTRSLLDTDDLYTRSYEEQLSARYVTEGTIAERSPSIFGKIFKGAASVAKGFLGFRRDGLTENSIDARSVGYSADGAIAERSPSIFGKIFKGAASVAKGFLGFRRDVSAVDLQTRSPELIVERSEEDMYARDFDEAELFERFNEEDLFERDFEDQS